MLQTSLFHSAEDHCLGSGGFIHCFYSLKACQPQSDTALKHKRGSVCVSGLHAQSLSSDCMNWQLEGTSWNHSHSSACLQGQQYELKNSRMFLFAFSTQAAACIPYQTASEHQQTGARDAQRSGGSLHIRGEKALFPGGKDTSHSQISL